MYTPAIALFSAVLALTSTAHAAVLPARATEGTVTLCTGENYTGDCTKLPVPFNKCQQLDAPYLKNLGSFKPEGQLYCRITYTADTCTLHGDAFVWPDTGAPTLHHFQQADGQVVDAGSMVTSFLCQECRGCEV